MPTRAPSHKKPVTPFSRPDLVRLPKLTPWRRGFRAFIRFLARLLVRLTTRSEVTGLENYPATQPALIVTNHLGDADGVLGIAISARPVEMIAKIDLYRFPVFGKLLDAYGVIWIHRGQPDRRSLKTAMQALQESRLVSIAPEGRESLTGALEEGLFGAAYLAIKCNVPVLPVTFTGTENASIFKQWKRLQRAKISVTVGKPFTLEVDQDWRKAVEAGTITIMNTLAAQLPASYRGVYQ
jgi:1-acyl-sn-glycerol-3-phosphate acyltransferase